MKYRIIQNTFGLYLVQKEITKGFIFKRKEWVNFHDGNLFVFSSFETLDRAEAFLETIKTGHRLIKEVEF